LCVFCDYLNNKEGVIFDNELVFAVYDKFPVNKGHMLIMPKRHVESYFELTPEEKKAMDALITEAKTFIDSKFKPDAYNLGINEGVFAGQSILHCHLHIIPRYIGDVSNPRGGVRGVIPAKQNY
jgi:diadenosine tetraphosphate (Ap4A) HIT family hydrolase